MNAKKRTTAATMMIAALTAITKRSSLVTREVNRLHEDARAFDADDAHRGSLCDELALCQHVDAPSVDGRNYGGAQVRRRRSGSSAQGAQISARNVVRPLRRAQRQPPSPRIVGHRADHQRETNYRQHD